MARCSASEPNAQPADPQVQALLDASVAATSPRSIGCSMPAPDRRAVRPARLPSGSAFAVRALVDPSKCSKVPMTPLIAADRHNSVRRSNLVP